MPFSEASKAPVHAAEFVVRCAEAVERNADVVEIALGDLGDVALVDQRAVRRQADVEALGLGALGDVVDIRPEQRLAAGQDQHRHLEVACRSSITVDLLGIQFAGEIGVGGNRVAMLAGQVAAPDQVPDHHRAGRIALGTERRRLGDFLHVLGDAKHGFPDFGLSDIQWQRRSRRLDMSQRSGP
jgi:hypothetical protein